MFMNYMNNANSYYKHVYKHIINKYYKNICQSEKINFIEDNLQNGISSDSK